MTAPASAEQIREVNARYHDVAASEYDAKWGIDYGEVGHRQVAMKLRKLLGGTVDDGFGDALEIGAGTGYFSLNLLQTGFIERATCTDISPGMLATLEVNAALLGLDVKTATAEASALPFADASFDIVLGHAVLHHLPDLDGAFREFMRVLRPGGTLAFAGEPSRYGDRLATIPKRSATTLAPVWRRLVGAAARGNGHDVGTPDDHALEAMVDVHAFAPEDLRSLARNAGFEEVRVRGEELLANWFGWANRALEATAEPAQVPWLWRQYAYRGYIALQQVDARLLERRLPPAIFYNLMVAARKPAG